MKKAVVFDGTVDSIKNIMDIVPAANKTLKVTDSVITIPTIDGDKAVYVNDKVVVNGDRVSVEYYMYS